MKIPTHTGLGEVMTQTRAQTDSLFRLIRPEAWYERPVPMRHRLIFYLGHLEAFDLNLFGQERAIPSLHPEFDQLFAFGIDPDSGQLPQDERSDWPELPEVERYTGCTTIKPMMCMAALHTTSVLPRQSPQSESVGSHLGARKGQKTLGSRQFTLR